MTSVEQMAEAAAHHEAGRLPEAEQLYRRIVDDQPDHHAAWILLGDVLSDSSRPIEALECYQRVITADPDSITSAAAYDGLAAILQDQGRLDDAIAASRRAVELRGDADAAYVLGRQLEGLGRVDAAMEVLSFATKLRPKFAEAHAKLGELWLRRSEHLRALECFQTAVDLQPHLAEAHCNLANALWRSGDEDAALTSARRAVELKPELAEAHNMLGVILKDRRRLADALAEFMRANQHRPDYPEAINNTGCVLGQLGRATEAAPFYERAVQLRPDSAEFHENLACNLLVRGEYHRGWAEYEWRRRQPHSSAGRNFGWPQWDGSDLDRRTILLHAEQGVGDTIQFARYIPMVHDRGGRVIVECQAAIAPVIARIDGVQGVVSQGEALPPFTIHSPLITLPLIFGTALDTVPNKTPYVTADPVRAAAWAGRLPQRDGKLRVGLGWAGNPRHKNDRDRSCPPGYLESLGAVPDVSFFSLQKNPNTPPPRSLGLIDFTSDLYDFGETAALLSHLDLVITVDTALAHLAGAMGKPVWIMLPFVPDWRWLTDRTDSPWYPTARLFRQPAAADWPSLVQRISQELPAIPNNS